MTSRTHNVAAVGAIALFWAISTTPTAWATPAANPKPDTPNTSSWISSTSVEQCSTLEAKPSTLRLTTTKRLTSSPSTTPAQRREQSKSHAISPPVPTAFTSPPQTTTPATAPTLKSPQNLWLRARPPISPAPLPAAIALTSPAEPAELAATRNRTRVRTPATGVRRKTVAEQRKTRRKLLHTIKSKPPASPPSPPPCLTTVDFSTKTRTKPSPPPFRQPDQFLILDSSWVGQSCSWA